MKGYIETYNTVRLHSAIGYITPADKLEGRAQVIKDERKRKLSVAVQRRKVGYQEHQKDQVINLDKSKGLEDYEAVV